MMTTWFMLRILIIRLIEDVIQKETEWFLTSMFSLLILYSADTFTLTLSQHGFSFSPDDTDFVLINNRVQKEYLKSIPQ